MVDISILTIKDRLEDLRFCHFVHKPPKTEQNLQKIPGNPTDVSIKYSVGLFSTSITYTPFTWSSIIQQMDLYQHLENYCSSQPSIVHWLSSSIFPCLVVRPAMVTSGQISLLVAPHPQTHTFSESL